MTQTIGKKAVTSLHIGKRSRNWLFFRRLALAIQLMQWFRKSAGTSWSMWTSRIQKCRGVLKFSRQPCKCRLHNLRKSSLQGGEITVDEYTRLINVLNPISGYTRKEGRECKSSAFLCRFQALSLEFIQGAGRTRPIYGLVLR